MTVLGTNERKIEAAIVEAGGGGVRLLAAAEVQPGTAVEVLLDDAILLGEVVHSSAAGSGWMAGIVVRQSLGPLGGLRRLIAALMEGGAERSDRPEPVASTAPGPGEPGGSARSGSN